MVTKRKQLKFSCIPIRQGDTTLYAMAVPAKTLWGIVQINERDPDKDNGYQRVLSASRVKAISKYIAGKNPIPTSVLISFGEAATVNKAENEITVIQKSDAGWVIDGQHRLAGANLSTKQIELPVIAFIGLDVEEQIRQFITINKEAKGVPTSLYYDLLSHLPIKSATDRAKERAADIAGELRKDEESPFYGRIVITTSPKKGELSLNNFVRKTYPLIIDGKGALSAYSVNEQKQIVSNYYRGLQVAFPHLFLKHTSVFFQTVGFGALINALPTFLSLCIKHHKAFKVDDVAKVFANIKHFDFIGWERSGTGSAAEIQAGEDLKTELLAAYQDEDGGVSVLDLG
jgi:DGQHR domain-containing protein